MALKKENLFNTEVGKRGRGVQHCVEKRHKDQNTLGYKLQQHVIVTQHNNQSLCGVLENFCENLGLQQNLITATSRTNSN